MRACRATHFKRMICDAYMIIRTHKVCLSTSSVDLNKRCDGSFDCKDKSDEKECQTIDLGEAYLKIFPPLQGIGF